MADMPAFFLLANPPYFKSINRVIVFFIYIPKIGITETIKFSFKFK